MLGTVPNRWGQSSDRRVCPIFCQYRRLTGGSNGERVTAVPPDGNLPCPGVSPKVIPGSGVGPDGGITARGAGKAKVSMSSVRVLVGTCKGAFVLTADGAGKQWKTAGPYFGGWEVFHVKG